MGDIVRLVLLWGLSFGGAYVFAVVWGAGWAVGGTLGSIAVWAYYVSRSIDRIEENQREILRIIGRFDSDEPDEP